MTTENPRLKQLARLFRKLLACGSGGLFIKFIMMYNLGPGQKIAVSYLSQYAPLNHAELGTFVEIQDDGYSSTSMGSGIYTNLKCETCGHGGKDLPNSEKNLCIYF
jgi:hypothetical protein